MLRHSSWRSRCASGGFSFIEVMVVLVIIGLLAGVVTINVRSSIIQARQTTARREIATICNALEQFYMTRSRYPTNEEGLEILRQSSEQMPEPLLTQRLVDPWGNPYQYNQPGREGPYEVFSLGADGRDGGADASSGGGGGANAVIGSWDLKGDGVE